MSGKLEKLASETVAATVTLLMFTYQIKLKMCSARLCSRGTQINGFAAQVAAV